MKPFPLFAALLCLVACDEYVSSNATDAALTETINAPRPESNPEACWDKTVSPATIETVTRKVLVEPAKISPDGQIQSPPVYRDETRQEVIAPRQEAWFETPCQEDLTPDFIASLQRALAARNYYGGAITGTLDRHTRQAIRNYQAERGLDSGTLAVSTAQALGLWAIDLPEPEPA